MERTPGNSKCSATMAQEVQSRHFAPTTLRSILRSRALGMGKSDTILVIALRSYPVQCILDNGGQRVAMANTGNRHVRATPQPRRSEPEGELLCHPEAPASPQSFETTP